MALELDQAALLSTPTPADLQRKARLPSEVFEAEHPDDLRSVALRWIVHVAYTSPPAADGSRLVTIRYIGRHPDGLPFANREEAERQAEIEERRAAIPGAEILATCQPLSPPDPMEAT